MSSKGLFPFMARGSIEISNRNNIDELNDVLESGIYVIVPSSDTYGTLIVFGGSSAAGATIQCYFHPAGINVTRIKNSNYLNTWTQL